MKKIYYLALLIIATSCENMQAMRPAKNIGGATTVTPTHIATVDAKNNVAKQIEIAFANDGIMEAFIDYLINLTPQARNEFITALNTGCSINAHDITFKTGNTTCSQLINNVNSALVQANAIKPKK